MKKYSTIYAAVPLLLLSVPASAQWLTNGTSIYYNGGKVGIGTSAPSNALHVVDPVNQGVGIFQNPNGRVGLGVDGSGGYLQADGIDFSFFAGSQRVLFGSSSTGRLGIGTTLPAAKVDVRTTDPFGLRVETTYPGGYGLAAVTPGGSINIGLYGDGALGYGAVTYGKFGTFGESFVAGGAGIYGSAGAGVAGTLAGQFQGNVQIIGSLSKSSGTFKIDHPLDPENKYLYHSFVESPDMMNVYRGHALLDASGSAVVAMPAYFEALNRDFEYQLTCVGGYAPVYVASKISGNQFQIAGGRPGLEVSWQVTGVRRDAYAELNRVKVEVEKAPEERGFYLHPEAFGQPAEQIVPSLRRDEAVIRKARSRK